MSQSYIRLEHISDRDMSQRYITLAHILDLDPMSHGYYLADSYNSRE